MTKSVPPNFGVTGLYNVMGQATDLLMYGHLISY